MILDAILIYSTIFSINIIVHVALFPEECACYADMKAIGCYGFDLIDGIQQTPSCGRAAIAPDAKTEKFGKVKILAAYG